MKQNAQSACLGLSSSIFGPRAHAQAPPSPPRVASAARARPSSLLTTSAPQASSRPRWTRSLHFLPLFSYRTLRPDSTPSSSGQRVASPRSRLVRTQLSRSGASSLGVRAAHSIAPVLPTVTSGRPVCVLRYTVCRWPSMLSWLGWDTRPRQPQTRWTRSTHHKAKCASAVCGE